LFIATLEKHPRFSLHCYTNPEKETAKDKIPLTGKKGFAMAPRDALF
jgi:hypothetical protein